MLTHKGRFRAVTETGTNFADKTYAVKFQCGTETIVTENHPYYIRDRYFQYVSRDTPKKRMLTEPNWIEVCDLDSNSFGATPIMSEESDIPELTNELCYMIGRYIADGHIAHYRRKDRIDSYTHNVIFSIGEDKAEEFEKNIKTYHYCKSKHGQSVYRYIFSSEWLEYLIVGLGLGDKASEKVISAQILNLPKDKLKAVIEGYLSGDGYYAEKQNKWFASTISHNLAITFALAVQKVYGTNCNIHYDDKRKTNVICGRTVNQSPIYTMEFKKSLSGKEKVVIDDGFVWSSLKYKEECGPAVVYNISVAEDESYVANNMVVHNCTKFSIANNKDRETFPYSGEGWELFYNGLLAKEKWKPDYILFENNHSIAQPIKDAVSECLGVGYTMIDSAKVSAQQRKRCYWTNFDVPQPEDRGILLRDILESGIVDREKSYALKHQQGNARDYIKKNHTQVAFEPIRVGTIENEAQREDFDSKQYRVYSPDGKATTLCGQGGGVGAKTGLYAVPVNETADGKAQCLRATYYKDGMRNMIGNTIDRKTCVAQPIKMLTEGEMDYMVRSVADGRTHFDFGYIQDATKDKGKCLTANIHKGVPYNVCIERADGTMTPVYEVRDGAIKYKDIWYPINLPDGYYIIRKLTVNECRRLQTIPDWYKMPVSATQSYKMLGNGWTNEVIMHILSQIPNIQNEEIEVLSMYDGMAGAMIALRELCCNVVRYDAYEIDKYCIQTAKANFPEIIHHGDASELRRDDWSLDR